ncbi:hypothetical protein [Ramlibacter tataouinensis]|uniref:DNA polymerase Y family protein n=1 Tax=Ramlibacter tataouinensis (strain ATCC BAA-407 / DSM 14655 / LMG 21543 / TTB310) TaxID=365046 RepID=F5Y4S5_RAMTT|nr:hypothetical protein [Ramlibacter tataouinensis]AEG92581.1 Conserved hypothetical protein [Ramlibacter tataouinensis TTB310]
MHWIALWPSHEDELAAWGWRALQFTPRVAQVGRALLLEVSGSERLFGGRNRLLHQVLQDDHGLAAPFAWAQGATSLVALALLRLRLRGQPPPAVLPGGLPLEVLDAAQEHMATLARAGCNSWGGLRALPRGGVARRFGAALLEALDAAYGERPERHAWLALPQAFDLKLELPTLATGAPELMGTAQRLLAQLQAWLQARHRGVLALELEWTLDLKRLDGVRLPSHEQLAVRTAQPTQDLGHLRRLVGEHLGRARLAAPASQLRLRSLDTRPWAGASRSFLPEDNPQGEPLHQLVERLSARLGAHNVRMPQAQADWRPERMQRWVPAASPGPVQTAAAVQPGDVLYPSWLLPQPLPLEVRDNRPWYEGPLRLLTRRQRVETGWWEEGGAVVRDCFIARSEQAGLLWIFCEHTVREGEGGWPKRHLRWYLQGWYA